jgi:hypothetical protein
LNNEPRRLRQGKEVHKRIQREWHRSAEGSIIDEKTITKPSGRKGRIDIFVASNQTLVAVAEIKCSKWDAMTLATVRRNVRRQAHQIWDYIESQLELGKDVSPGAIFPKLPKDPHRMKLVEQLFNEEGIAVVWEDETPTKRKARSQVI